MTMFKCFIQRKKKYFKKTYRRELRADCLTQSIAFTMVFKAVSEPRLYVVPGILLLIVAGTSANGMQNSSNSSRLLYSSIIPTNASNPPMQTAALFMTNIIVRKRDTLKRIIEEGRSM